LFSETHDETLSQRPEDESTGMAVGLAGVTEGNGLDIVNEVGRGIIKENIGKARNGQRSRQKRAKI
jgi:hypothetical protein